MRYHTPPHLNLQDAVSFSSRVAVGDWGHWRMFESCRSPKGLSDADQERRPYCLLRRDLPDDTVSL